jgi:arabinogalactan oligomer/maltooligosaccharide transport system substrate-binding protein
MVVVSPLIQLEKLDYQVLKLFTQFSTLVVSLVKVEVLSLLVAVLALVGLAACGDNGSSNGDKPTVDTNPLAGTYDITLWVSESEGVKELTETQIDEFEAANPGITINATIEGVTEADAATLVVADVATAPDMYCFAQDQLTRLVQANALAKLGDKTAQTVRDLNDGGSVKAASVAGNLYAYPLTSDNGYFMYYDKSVISEDIVGSLEDIIAACEAAKKNFSFEFETNGWYTGSFFFAVGCTTGWTTDENGEFTAVQDDFNSEKGMIAMKAMQKVLASPSYHNSSAAKDFAASVPSAVVVSCTWDSAKSK